MNQEPGARATSGDRFPTGGTSGRLASLGSRARGLVTERSRPWWSAGLMVLGLLLAPILVWLRFPAPSVPLPQIVAATVELAAPPIARPPPPPSPVATPRPIAAATTDADAAATPVRGKVLGPDGAPVARVWVGCSDREVHTVTEQDGTYELPPTAVGCAGVARRPGFGSSKTVAFEAGDARANLLELRGGGRIDGVVVDEKGAPVTKFMLAVEKFIGATEDDDEGSNGRARTIEDAEGRFSMQSATPGKYVLSASAEGRPPARSDMLEVESGRTLSGVRIVLARGARLTGVVTDAETRKPVAGARVALDSVTSSGVSSVPSVQSDEQGAYSLEGVPVAGPFSIRVAKDGYRSRVVSGLWARGGAPIASDVQLQPGSGSSSDESELGGIGAILAPHPKALGAIVVGVTPDGPAARAGLQRQDWIVRIDGASTETMTLVDCLQRLRGQPGTRLAVVVSREGKEIAFDITRENVVVSRPGRN